MSDSLEILVCTETNQHATCIPWCKPTYSLLALVLLTLAWLLFWAKTVPPMASNSQPFAKYLNQV